MALLASSVAVASAMIETPAERVPVRSTQVQDAMGNLLLVAEKESHHGSRDEET
ncbi:protein of unknown function [Hyphomicrobium sp. MC1]|nr:protein of unknown function [Hyphomicrobium sp. MC1]